MKRFFATALFLLSAISLANGQALVVTACGTVPSTYTRLGAVLPFTVDTTGKLCSSAAGGGGTPGGSNTQVQWNNLGTFAGFTLGGDATLVTSTGIMTIANTAVTYAKMQNISAASLLLGRGSAAGAGSPQEITLGTNLSMSGTTLNATGGAGAPGGASLTVQYNNAGAFGGMSGTSWDDTNRSLTLTGATITTSNPVLNLSQTWNAGAVAFTGFKLNVTDTLSASTSLLLDLQVATISKFNIDKGGNVGIAGGVSAGGNVNALGFSSTVTNGTVFTVGGSSNYGNFYVGASAMFRLLGATNLGILLRSDGTLMWQDTSSGGSVDTGQSSTPDLFLRREGPGVLNQRNAANAQAIRVYNTFTDAANYERGVFDWGTTANILTIGAQAAGTGTLRQTKIVGNTLLLAPTVGSTSITFDGGGFFPTANNVLDLGLPSGGQSWHTITLNQAVAWESASTVDASISRAGASTLRFGDGATNTNGWFRWAGQTRVTADVTFTSTTTLATVTGLSVNVLAGRTYTFEAELSFTDAAAGGIQAAIAGTATATNIVYDGWIVDSAANGIKGNTQATALGTAVASSTTTGTAGHVTIKGTITVNLAGTLLVQSAQNTSNATPTTIKRGSYFIVYDMP